MLAESDEDECYLMRSLLELKGFAVLEAHDGQQAVDLAVRKLPDLLIVQLKLPVINGFTVIRRIRKHDQLRNVPIIAVSLNNPTSNQNLAMAAGSDAHLEKPIEFDRLEVLLDKFLPGERLNLASALVQ